MQKAPVRGLWYDLRMRAVLALSLLLSACATSQPIYLPDGSAGHAINCDGSAMSWSLCFQKAGELCGASGYTILERSDDKAASATVTPQWGAVGAVVTRSMLVKCNG